MLIKVTVSNYKSFDKEESLSMISSTKIQEHKDHRIKIKKTNILKHSVVYGANASGKSNLAKVFSFIQKTLIEGIPVSAINDFCRNRTENRTRESNFELQFTVADKFYAYGFSAILSERRIIEEWLYELKPDGTSRNLFIREGDKSPVINESINLTGLEKSKIAVYIDDFSGDESQLFLTEMNRSKKYSDDSQLLFFKTIFDWIKNNIIVINPNNGISDIDTYYKNESVENIAKLIKTFDTGVTDIKTKVITVDEITRLVPREFVNKMVSYIKNKMQDSPRSEIKMTWRFDNGFYNIHIEKNSEPEITTLILKHGKSVFDFDFAEESDGTKRLFDLIDMLMTKRKDVVFVVDELERSLHPKLTQHFLKLFIEAHTNEPTQLIFTTHEDTIMDQHLFRRDEIWFVERGVDNATKIYSLDKFKERYDKKLSKAYLDGRYGAIPVFEHFSFRKEE